MGIRQIGQALTGQPLRGRAELAFAEPPTARVTLPSDDGARVRVNPDLIAAENSPNGRRYQVRDGGLSGAGIHSYELIEWETTGARRVYGPFTVRVAPAATISKVQWTGEGKLVVGFSGTPGAEYLVESSPHLETGQWEVLGRIRADAAGVFRWVETVKPEEPTRFFRAIQP